MGTHHNIGEYIAADDSMTSASDFFEHLVEGVGVGVGAVGSHGRFIYVNEHYADTLGYSRESLVGSDLETVNPEFDQSRFEEYWDSFSIGETRTTETVHRTADGEVFPVLTHVTRVVVTGSAVNVGTIQDITELERRGEQLDVLRRVLRHDLRNRLNVVSGYADLIERQLEVDDDLREHFERIQREIDHLLATSENSRRLEKLLEDDLAGNRDRPTDVIRLDRTLEVAVSRVRDQFPEATVRFDEPGAVRVRAAEYVGQALTHVLSNAVIHNDSEDPTVDLEVTTVGDRISLSVADDGPGIPDERKDLVFGREETDQLHHGNGFGLFFVENVITESGGEIRIEDNEPRGTAVEIELPRPRVDP